MQNTSADAMIKRLNKWFARLGIPKYIVSVKGPQFLSGQFRRYCDLNNIRHIRSAPYHPKTNGLAERTVRTLKGLFGRQLKTSLDWIRPNAEHEIVRANDRQSLHHDFHSKEREFEISQPIWLNNEIPMVGERE
ncbi:igE-binding protein-like [Gordionus sp. m RMFG-2023]|uniref:igE-binding protein-like n=1 Tax=Gordionus sp. m RMFG-2023 TaxID=3053472 RepID=UPI0031FDC72E